MGILSNFKLVGIMLVFFSAFLPNVYAEIDEKDDRMLLTGNESLKTIIEQGYIEQKGTRCFLQKPIHVQEDGRLIADGKDCSVLYMYPESYIRIVGEAYFYDIRVTSWDPVKERQITLSRDKYYTKRPHVYTKHPAKHVHIENSEFSHLGYYNASDSSAWGVSFWGLASGNVVNSKFHHNYFGLYTYETNNVTVKNSEVYHNLEYGLDFHDYSDNFLVQDNTVYDNGNHGIIFSKYCDHNKIIGNLVYDHTMNAFVKGVEQDYGVHGIMLHKFSNNNLVKENTLRNNRVGIILYKSNENQILQNLVLSDLEEGVYIDQSTNNLVKDNIVLETKGFGLYVYNSSNNVFTDNYFENDILFKGTTQDSDYRYVNKTSYVPEMFNGEINPGENTNTLEFDEYDSNDDMELNNSDSDDLETNLSANSQANKSEMNYNTSVSGNGESNALANVYFGLQSKPDLFKLGFMFFITVLGAGVFLFELISRRVAK